MRDAEQQWKEYCNRELAAIKPLLTELGFTLDQEQPHVGGERYLMQAVTTASGKKLVLLGQKVRDGKRVVIKASSDYAGIQELEHERKLRKTLSRINFAYRVFFSPEEILFKKQGGHVLSIQEFVAQDRSFLERSTEEQFSLILASFKAQEGAHATTYRHQHFAEAVFGNVNAEWYLQAFRQFQANIKMRLPLQKKTHELMERGGRVLEQEREIIDRYSGFLTHTDFVPHNFRIRNGKVYLLDHSSLRFGNKYEGWARFLNFMTLYNRPLEDALLFYVQNNRVSEEYRSLELMRIYKLGEIIWFYAHLLEKTTDNLRKLTEARIDFWSHVLAATLNGSSVSEHAIAAYKRTRDSLRSAEEWIRQKGLH